MKYKNLITPDNAEIALTYKCQNRCEFCSIPDISVMGNYSELSTSEVMLLIDRLQSGGIRSITFTGGEPTLRNDLLTLIEYTSGKGISVRLFSNGIKLSDKKYTEELINAGLSSAQISLHAGDELLQNIITGNVDSFAGTVSGVHNLIDGGIETGIKCTITRNNMKILNQLADFIVTEFKFSSVIFDFGVHYSSNGKGDITYTSMVPFLEDLLRYCTGAGIKLTLGTPVPYCIFNPEEWKIHTEHCRAMSSVIAVNPAGEVTACHGSRQVLGSLVRESLESILNGKEADRYRRRKKLPSVCKNCGVKTQCAGACPLYWEKAGSFREIEKAGGRSALLDNFASNIDKRIRLKRKDLKGVKDGSLLSPFQ